MKCRVRFRNIVATICLTTFSGMVLADDTGLNLALSYELATNEADAVQGHAEVTPVIPAVEFQPQLLSSRKAHQYMGLGTLALFGLTAIAAPNSERNTKPQTSGIHQTLGRTTAAMAAATVATGLLFHWDDIHLKDGFTDPDNLHAMLGAAGALAMLYAVSVAPGHGHPGAGIAGGAAMAVAVKLTW